MLPFLSNVNDTVSSKDKDEVETMTAVVPNISKVVTHYTSHRLCANVKFSSIDAIMQSMMT